MSIAETFPSKEIKVSSGILFGEYYPETRLTNEEIASWDVRTDSGRLLTADEIYETVGVARRTIANDQETVLFMGEQAVRPIVDRVGRKIDAVFFTTSYPTGQHNSTEIASLFHLEADDTQDIHAACSGFTLALTFIKDHEQRFIGRRILAVASEKYSPTLPDLKNGEKDPSLSQTIFADGATVVSFVYGKDLTVLGYRNYESSSFPEGSQETIRMPIDYNLVRYPAITIEVPSPLDGKFWMNGRKVHEALVRAHPQQILEAIESAGLSPSDISLIVSHQPSIQTLGSIARAIGKREPSLADKFVFDIEDGNYSSAAVPKAFMRALEEERVKPGDIVVFDGFGAGLFASIVVAQLDPQN